MVSGADEEIENDAIQLLTIANFNGICRVISALAQNGFLEPAQLDGIHEAMSAPLDDPDWRDYSFLAETRNTLETVLAKAMMNAKE